MFDAITEYGVVGKAIQTGLLSLNTINPRDFATNKYQSVDDRPYGGGPGMVMQYQPLHDAINAAKVNNPAAKVIYLSPQGERLTQSRLNDFKQCDGLILLNGRYEGIDERLLEADVDCEISIGDYVLSGGELASMVFIDALARLIPGVLGHEDSAEQDSFVNGLLDCPHYSRPEVIEGRAVPQVLLSGDHAAIEQWRLKQSLGRTWQRRPDLLAELELTDEQQRLLNDYIQQLKN
jgi:tRNA (guanine37-N1)-methyltransferase